MGQGRPGGGVAGSQNRCVTLLRGATRRAWLNGSRVTRHALPGEGGAASLTCSGAARQSGSRIAEYTGPSASTAGSCQALTSRSASLRSTASGVLGRWPGSYPVGP